MTGFGVVVPFPEFYYPSKNCIPFSGVIASGGSHSGGGETPLSVKSYIKTDLPGKKLSVNSAVF